MSTFSTSVWHRLAPPGQLAPGQRHPSRLTLAQYQRVIARDLETLLNTRIAITDGELAPYPCCRRSIANFGLADFAQMCLTSSDDRNEICARLKAAIERHEPRLSQVRVQLVQEPGAINRLSFSIRAQLLARPDDGRVQFDVMLEPSSQHYSIR
jgi:type VI secretion system protein ImpF